ncbi:hypothetical protein LTR97_001056 [Elasticomyces elasticus]|uniref:Uncharacterized protein n=1 Tax=Elasticomyces elasticus TaxID=574655 RepID=A0AAN8A4T0_9PEZI|nr:hypothetical protein LTR97_001056 [Elasticomyces elasticus]
MAARSLIDLFSSLPPELKDIIIGFAISHDGRGSSGRPLVNGSTFAILLRAFGARRSQGELGHWRFTGQTVVVRETKHVPTMLVRASPDTIDSVGEVALDILTRTRDTIRNDISPFLPAVLELPYLQHIDIGVGDRVASDLENYEHVEYGSLTTRFMLVPNPKEEADISMYCVRRHFTGNKQLDARLEARFKRIRAWWKAEEMVFSHLSEALRKAKWHVWNKNRPVSPSQDEQSPPLPRPVCPCCSCCRIRVKSLLGLA